jgi:NAD(P)H dehydrogenase (quinone)
MPPSYPFLILYYSVHGATRSLALAIARGVESVPGVEARLRTVPRVAPSVEIASPPVPDAGAPYVEPADLEDCIGLALGSPTRFGNMAAPLKHFLDTTAPQWAAGTLAGKPAGVFTSSTSLHGGQESTLLTMMVPLLHHGMVIVGIPYTEADVSTTSTGGSPYGPTHWSGAASADALSNEEKRMAHAFGARLARTALALVTLRTPAPGGTA